MSPPRIGVVLSSGGTRGVYAHTGFLIALERLGIPVAAATGSSAGAVVGGMAASGTDLRAWSETIAHIAPARFWRPDPVAYVLWQFLIRRGQGLYRVVQSRSGVQQSAMEQTQAYLGSYVDALLSDPRSRLPPAQSGGPA